MNDEKEETQIISQEALEQKESQPLETERKPEAERFDEVVGEQAPEVSKGIKIIEDQKKVDEETLKIHEANEGDLQEFEEGQVIVGKKLKDKKNEYDEEIERLQKDIPNVEDRISEIKKESSGRAGNKEENSDAEDLEKKVSLKTEESKEEKEGFFRTPGDIITDNNERILEAKKRNKSIKRIEEKDPYLINRIKQMESAIAQEEQEKTGKNMAVFKKELKRLEKELNGKIELDQNPEKQRRAAAIEHIKKHNKHIAERPDKLKAKIEKMKGEGKNTALFEKKLEEANTILEEEISKFKS